MKIKLMFNVVFSELVHKTIHNFIDSYKESFLKLFSDTWIYYEEQIKNSYIETSNKFQREIYSSIEKQLKLEIIWKKVNNNWFRCLVLSWNYKIFTYFQEDEKTKTRFINNIEIYKK